MLESQSHERHLPDVLVGAGGGAGAHRERGEVVCTWLLTRDHKGGSSCRELGNSGLWGISHPFEIHPLQPAAKHLVGGPDAAFGGQRQTKCASNRKSVGAGRGPPRTL